MRSNQLNSRTGKKLIAPLFYTGATLLIGVVIITCCSIGRYDVLFTDVLKALANYLFGAKYAIEYNVYSAVIFMRLPRVLMAVLVGIALSLSGCVYQSVFNNKLISPDLLGVSEGGCVGAAFAILIGCSSIVMMLISFACGLIAVGLALLIPVLMRNKTNVSLVLSGIVVSAIFSSILGIIKYTVDSLEKLEAITFWIMGSFARVTMQDVVIVAPIIIIATTVLILLRHRINIIALGRNEAQSLGVNFGIIRIIVVVCATLLTACSTAICGTVSWVGLIVPHIARILVGPNNVKLVPMSLLLGGVMLPIIDTLCRTLTINEIPISILTAAFGAIVFCCILIKKGRNISD